MKSTIHVEISFLEAGLHILLLISSPVYIRNECGQVASPWSPTFSHVSSLPEGIIAGMSGYAHNDGPRSILIRLVNRWVVLCLYMACLAPCP